MLSTMQVTSGSQHFVLSMELEPVVQLQANTWTAARVMIPGSPWELKERQKVPKRSGEDEEKGDTIPAKGVCSTEFTQALVQMRLVAS